MIVSIIIPVYNASAYIDACLESIVNQSYEDLEIIIIDDGSTDDTPNLCDMWAARDDRILVIHQSNCGLASSRNIGFAKSTGSWIWFIDADDIIELNSVEVLLNDAINHNPDIVIMDIRPFGPDGDLPRSLIANKPFPLRGTVSGKRLMEMYALSNVESFAWSMFFSASFLKSFDGIGSPFMDGCRMLEDMALMWQIAAMEPTVFFEDKKLYGYRQTSGSLIHKIDFRNASSGYEALCLVNSLKVPPKIKYLKDVKTLECLLMVDGQAGTESKSSDLHRAIRNDVLSLWKSVGWRKCSIVTNARCTLVVLGMHAHVKLLIDCLKRAIRKPL